jgi:hypothetical protein
MPKIEFVGQSAFDPGNKQGATGRLVNLYREPAEGRFVLRPAPGMASFASLGLSLMRAMQVVGGVLYAVCGGRLFSVTSAAVVTNIGAIADSESTTIAGNYGSITVVAGGVYYVWNGTTLTTPTLPFAVSSLAYIGGYTVLAETNGRRLQWSGLATPATLPGLSFASSESTDEPILRIMTFGDTLLVFKANSVERWQVTGSAGALAFVLITGSVIETGLDQYSLLTKLPNGAAFVANDGRVYLIGTAAPISTPALESVLKLYTAQRMFYYETRGHGMICITFDGIPAWCFDIAMGEWHERAEGVLLGEWTAKASDKLGSDWVIGLDNGSIGVFSETLTDFGATHRRTAVSRMYQPGQRFSIKTLEFRADMGATLLATTPKLQVKFSRDGLTYGMEKSRNFGATGEYYNRMQFQAMGQFRQITVQVDMTGSVATPFFTDCEMEI